jgi:hypothetical protein
VNARPGFAVGREVASVKANKLGAGHSSDSADRAGSGHSSINNAFSISHQVSSDKLVQAASSSINKDSPW